MAEDLKIQVIGGGDQWTFQDFAACPSLTKVLAGDGGISWEYPFVQFTDRLPPRHASVTVEDPTGIFQRGRIAQRNPSGTDLCSGPCRLAAEGDSARLGDRKFLDDVRFGPRWPGEVTEFPLLASTAGGAVEYAFGYGGAGLEWSTANVTAGTYALTSSEQFRGRPMHDVFNAMNALSAGSATPYVWTVRNGIFRWRPLDLGPRYEVSIADGAIVTPSDDATRLYTHVIILYGNGQYAHYPDTVDYTHLPTLVDLVINAGNEVHDAAAAQRLAEGLYGRIQYLELGWSCTVTVPAPTEIRYLNPVTMMSEPVLPYRVNAAEFIRIPDLNGVTRYGPHHPVGNVQLMTEITWAGKDLSIRCGEIRDQSAVVRQVMYAGSSRTVHALRSPGLSVPTRDADKTGLLGPGLPAPASGAPPAIDNWIPPLSTENKQTLITHEAPKPIKLITKVFSADGGVLAAGLLDTAIYCDDLPPCEIDHVFLSCSPLGSVTVQAWKAQQAASSDGRGAFVVVADALVPDTLLLTATVTAGKFYQHRFTGATGDAKPRNETDAMLIYVITGTPDAVTSFKLSVNGNRIALGHPAGHDTMPALGVASA